MQRSVRWLFVASVVAIVGVFTGAAVSRPIPVRSLVGCNLWIDRTDRPYPEAGIILDRIGLPRGRYPWRIVRTRDPITPFWLKWGVLLRAGTSEPVTLSVARPWRRHAEIGWGNGWASSVRFLPCRSSSAWLVYAGGFRLKKRGCVPFDVQVGKRIQRLRIAFGRPCTT